MSASARKIAILGAESTGKTTLSRALAHHLGGALVPECLRDFCARHERTPQQHEQAGIIAEQKQWEARALQEATRQQRTWVICDTSPLMVALYSVACFGDHHLLPQALDWQRGYWRTLLCVPDLDWVADGIQRDGPQARKRIHATLVATLQQHGLPWWPVSGSGPQRLRSALRALQRGPI